MKTLIIKDVENTRQMIESADKGIQAIAFTRRPKLLHMLIAAENVKKLKTIFLAPAYMKTTGESTKIVMDAYGIKIVEMPGDGLRGKRFDIEGTIIEME